MTNDSKQQFGLLRPAPEPRLKAIPVDEALNIAKKAFHDARYAQCELMAMGMNHLLFDRKQVTYGRLLSLRGAARAQVENAQQVGQLIDDAIEAFQATAPVDGEPRG